MDWKKFLDQAIDTKNTLDDGSLDLFTARIN